MPNTLAHIGVQGIVTKAIFRNIDPKWVYVGCIIPDIPWILRRIILFVYPDINHLSVTISAIVQASLFFSFLLSGMLAAFSLSWRKTLSILGFNSLLHLILDACEIKWGNGVHLFAPFNWKITNFGFFWPDSLMAYSLTILGLVVFLSYWRESIVNSLDLTWKSGKRILVAICLLAIYIIFPPFLLNGPLESDSLFLKTLNETKNRPGRYIELDRAYYMKTPSGGTLRSDITLLKAEGHLPDQSATISVRGNFFSEDGVNIIEYHVHKEGIRDNISRTGLLLIVFLWFFIVVIKKGPTSEK